ncbi:MAG TPA: tetratricopeptide repeat protein [Candidatus Limnocylindrales bacterium]|nr:tetratricopeptide repeat protein [Candidatus Limnocylindrales bacterium]
MEQLGKQALSLLESNAPPSAAQYESIAGPLERIYDTHRKALDGMSKAVIAADGDMDALFETPQWRDHQAQAAQALYYLNWLRYWGAQAFSGQKRKDLLDEAASGFGEFATGSGNNPIIFESRLGRGLVYLESDHADWAAADFEFILESPAAPPERKRKAALALAEAYLKLGNVDGALQASKDALDHASAADQPRARIARARALAMAAASRPSVRDAYRSEATALLSSVQASGGPLAGRAGQILKMGLSNPGVWGSTAKAAPEPPPPPPPPSEWDITKKMIADGKYKDAMPRLEQELASTDEKAREHAGEAAYLLGLAKFRTNDRDGAIAAFDLALADKGKAYYRDDAAYLRFKAEEAIYNASIASEKDGSDKAAGKNAGGKTAADKDAAAAKGGASPADASADTAASAEREQRYEKAIKEFVTAFPDHKAAGEAHFRLGEIRQRQEKWTEAVAHYAKVKGDPSFEFRAAFATAQSYVKQLEQLPEDTPPDPVLRKKATDALAAFHDKSARVDAAALGESTVQDLRGRAALMSAYMEATEQPPRWEQALAHLEGFEEKYPKLVEQRLQIVRLRLAAASRLGRLQLAATEAARPEVARLEPVYLDDLSSRLLVLTAREQAKGNVADADAGRRACLLLTEAALASPQADETLTPAVRQRMRSTAASLNENAGQRERALALYRSVLEEKPEEVSARAGAARILEAQGNTTVARALWDEIVDSPETRAGWLEAHYQSARLSDSLGEKERACKVLRKVPASMLQGATSGPALEVARMLRACPPPQT